MRSAPRNAAQCQRRLRLSFTYMAMVKLAPRRKSAPVRTIHLALLLVRSPAATSPPPDGAAPPKESFKKKTSKNHSPKQTHEVTQARQRSWPRCFGRPRHE